MKWIDYENWVLEKKFQSEQNKIKDKLIHILYNNGMIDEEDYKRYILDETNTVTPKIKLKHE
jgi:hypothetical protein